MKNSWKIGEGANGEFLELLAFDRKEIDNPDLHDRVRLHYLSRVTKVIDIVKKYFPNSTGINVGEFGCNQANTGLLLAEAGYDVVAVDIVSSSLRYSQEKYEKGSIRWVEANIESLGFPQNSLDVIILGENLTIFAHPERLLANMIQYLRPSGLLIVSIPNGSLVGWTLPTLHQMRQQNREAELIRKQYGNAHLYKLTLQDLEDMRPPGTHVLESSYCGGTLFFNKYTQTLLRLLPVSILEKILRILARVPLVNQKTMSTICVVFLKN